MRNLFALTAGEFLVGQELQHRKFEVWIPAKDTGIDLMATKGSDILRLQVKESRVWIHDDLALPRWTSWTGLNSSDLTRAAHMGVDRFVFVIHAIDDTGLRPRFKKPHYVLISPTLLDQLVARYRPGSDDRTVYWTIDDEGRLWEVRGAQRNYAQFPQREFTEFLEAWPTTETSRTAARRRARAPVPAT